MKKKKPKFSKQFKKRIQARKTLEKNAADSRQMLMQRIKLHAAREGHEVTLDTSNPLKMSEIIIHYASPLLESTEPGKDRERALIVAITLWNLAMVPESKRQEIIDTTFSKIYGKDYPPDFDQVLAYFIERKQLLYPDINQVILDYDYVQTPEGYHLNVVSNVK